MSCLGVHFALTEKEVEVFREFKTDEQRLEHLQEVIEEEYMNREDSPPLFAESDKAWDAIHRILADGELTSVGGEYPLNHTVLGGEPLYFGDDYIMILKNPNQVKEVAKELVEIDFGWFSERYRSIDSEDYGFPLDDEDLSYTWEWFQGVRDLYVTAALLERSVLFTADQ